MATRGGGFLNDDTPWPGSYNPYITLAHLRALAGGLNRPARAVA